MLISDNQGRRIVVDVPQRRVLERLSLIPAVTLFVVGGCSVLWFAALLALGLSGAGIGELRGTPLTALGGIGLAISALVLAFGLWFWRVVRKLRSQYPTGAVIAGVAPEHVELPKLGSVPYRSLTGATVRWEPVHHAPAITLGGMLGREIGRHAGTAAGVNAHRTIAWQLQDGSVVHSFAAPFATDEEFGRVVDALRNELGRRGMTLATAQQ